MTSFLKLFSGSELEQIIEVWLYFIDPSLSVFTRVFTISQIDIIFIFLFQIENGLLHLCARWGQWENKNGPMLDLRKVRLLFYFDSRVGEINQYDNISHCSRMVCFDNDTSFIEEFINNQFWEAINLMLYNNDLVSGTGSLVYLNRKDTDYFRLICVLLDSFSQLWVSEQKALSLLLNSIFITFAGNFFFKDKKMTWFYQRA